MIAPSSAPPPGTADFDLGLTPREQEVLLLLAAGKLYKEIAEELRVSVSAIHKHQHNIFQKLQVENRTEAAMRWIIGNHGASPLPGL